MTARSTAPTGLRRSFAVSSELPTIWAVSLTRLSRLLADVIPEYDQHAKVQLIQRGFEEAADYIREHQHEEPCDVVVAAGSNGAYLKSRVPCPVVLMRANGFDLMQALARARRVSDRIGVITHQFDLPEFTAFKSQFGLEIEQRSFLTAEDARDAIAEFAALGIRAVVGTGLAVELAEQAGMAGILVYSADTVRSAFESALDIARAARVGSAISGSPFQARVRASSTKALDDLLGDSEPMLGVRERVRLYSSREEGVLLSGETGSGKELVARALHDGGRRSQKPFIAVNCGALSESLLEAELFGYDDGAFTGARRGGRRGLIESAHGGTLFLDEIGEMPLSLQTRLLRVLEQREVLRVGASQPTPVEIRVVAATHRDLRRMVAEGKFRLDLFYRLDVLRIAIPPLRERQEDLALLACHFLEAAAGRRLRLSTAALGLLGRYPWPGNVRELRNVMDRLAVHASETGRRAAISAAELGQQAPELLAPPEMGEKSNDPGDMNNVRGALRANRGKRGRTAAALGISRSTLWRRLKSDGVNDAG